MGAALYTERMTRSDSSPQLDSIANASLRLGELLAELEGLLDRKVPPATFFRTVAECLTKQIGFPAAILLTRVADETEELGRYGAAESFELKQIREHSFTPLGQFVPCAGNESIIGLRTDLGSSEYLLVLALPANPARNQRAIVDEVLRECTRLIQLFSQPIQQDYLVRQKVETQFWDKLHSDASTDARTSELSAIFHNAAEKLRNDLRSDRVTLLASDVTGWRLLASSQTAEPDPRSELAKSTLRLIGKKNVGPGYHLFKLDTENCKDLGNMTRAGILQVYTDQKSRTGVAALAEYFEESSAFESNIDQQAIRKLASAVQNFRLRSLTGIGWSFAKSSAIWLRALLLTLIGFSILAVLFFIPASIRVQTLGVVQPRERWTMYAPEDGLVEVLVRNDQKIEVGTPILRIESAQLNEERTRLQAELNNARVEVELVASYLARANADDMARAEYEVRATVLQKRVEGLEEQLQLLKKRFEDCTLLAKGPGRITTWEFLRKFQHRPVSRGQRLGVLANLDGEWELELEVMPNDSGWVRRAIQSEERRQDIGAIDFTIRGEPSRTYAAKLETIELLISAKEDGTKTFSAKASVDSKLERVGSGGQVNATIRCESSSLGYVLFRRFVETLRSEFWL